MSISVKIPKPGVRDRVAFWINANEGLRRVLLTALSFAFVVGAFFQFSLGNESSLFVLSLIAIAAGLIWKLPALVDLFFGTARSPLSHFPATSRPLNDTEMIGRDEVLGSLVDSTNDALIIGQPGAGKTLLLIAYVERASGWFVHGGNRDELVKAIRRCSPGTLVVGDAVPDDPRIIELRQIRNELGLPFRILVDCWPWSANGVATAMAVGPISTITMQPLTADEIVEVIEGAGLIGPNSLIAEIREQANGRPGLAVTLANLCLSGDVNHVQLGRELLTDVEVSIGRVIDKTALQLLAGLAAGGERGMGLEATADMLGISLADARTTIRALGTAGVITETHSGSIIVEPRQLRYALVRDVIFQGNGESYIERVLRIAEDVNSVVDLLIYSKGHGASVSDSYIRDLVSRYRDRRNIKLYAHLGGEECQWVLDQNLLGILEVIGPGLRYIPEIALRALLDASATDSRQLNATPDHPLRQIEDWIKSPSVSDGEPLNRRELLLEALEQWPGVTENGAVAAAALQFAISPELQGGELDPGSGSTYTISGGHLSAQDVDSILEFWPRARALLGQLDRKADSKILELLHVWVYPGRLRLGRGPTSDVDAAMTKGARMMVNEVSKLFPDRNALQLKLEEASFSLGMNLHDSFVDPDFAVLYPVDVTGERFELPEDTPKAIDEIAARWAALSPKEFVDKLMQYELDARHASLRYPRNTPVLCNKVAEQTAYPVEIARRLLDCGAESDLTQHFIKRVESINPKDWEELIRIGLEIDGSKGTCAIAALRNQSISQDLADLCLRELYGNEFAIYFTCRMGELPPCRIDDVLTHANRDLASAAANGIWASKENIELSEQQERDWATAIVDTSIDNGGNFRKLLDEKPELRAQWVAKVLNADSQRLFKIERLILEEISKLAVPERIDAIDALPDRFFYEGIVERLVGVDSDAYRALLRRNSLRHMHLVFIGHHIQEWAALIPVALECGYSEQELASAAVGHFPGPSALEEPDWNEFIRKMNDYEEGEDPAIRRIARDAKHRAMSIRGSSEE